MGDNEQETLSNVTASDVDFDDESFDEISPEAKQFITTLLRRQERLISVFRRLELHELILILFTLSPLLNRARPSCDECLKHIWLKKASEDASNHRKSLNVAVINLKKFVARRKWVVSVGVGGE